jgi:O-antigen/teichoic acid export membrane protein
VENIAPMPLTRLRQLAAFARHPNSAFLRHIGWNLLGQGAPMLAALISIPLLIKGIGVDRFGILTIAWMLIGYFSLFDLGIGRAMTQLVSEKLARDEYAALPALIWTGLIAMLALGMVATVLIVGLSGWAIDGGLKIPLALRAEAGNALLVLAPAVPMVVVATGLRGILEARQQFRATNLVRIPLGILMFVGPLCVLPWTDSLVAIFAILLAIRLGTMLTLFRMCRSALPEIAQVRFERRILPELFKFGGWMTVSNIISPVMVQMDRFAIGAMLSMAAVTYYATPFEMVTKILMISGAISGVAFPTFARILAQGNRAEANRLYWRSVKLVALGTLPPVLIIVLCADLLLRIWLHDSFPSESAMVLRILAFGVLLNALAAVPFACLQGARRADITAKIHMLEVPFYVLSLLLVVPRFGIVGAALIWTARVTVDAVLMHYCSRTLRAAHELTQQAAK